MSRFNSANPGNLGSDTRTFEDKTRNEVGSKPKVKSNITSMTAAAHAEQVKISEEKASETFEEGKEKTER